MIWFDVILFVDIFNVVIWNERGFLVDIFLVVGVVFWILVVGDELRLGGSDVVFLVLFICFEL